MTSAVPLQFDNAYARLPERFFARQSPTPVSAPSLLCLNTALAEELSLKATFLGSEEGIAMLAGNHVPAGAEPIAMAYAGHQFGGWAPQLGDGRAILLGEVKDMSGRRQDIQLKGAGQTPFSRRGDGRAWLGPVLREYIVSETMAAYGIPTTRALAAVLTGELVQRESVLPGAILTRVAGSHIRVGTFEYFAAREDNEALCALSDFVIERHYPELANGEQRYAGLLGAVLERQASLIARWMGVGFIHGVMNTDNMAVSGDTIDYGPCAFMDDFDPKKVFSSIDHQGRYAYQNQPPIAQWNLVRLAQSLLPLIEQQCPEDNSARDDDGSNDMKVGEGALAQAQAIIDSFAEKYSAAYLSVMRGKLGLATEEEEDLTLLTDLLRVMHEQSADFTNSFRALSLLPLHRQNDETDAPFITQFTEASAADAWLQQWRERLQREASCDEQRRNAMQKVNPAFIPRNHQIEAVIEAAVQGDMKPFHRFMAVLSTPFTDQPEARQYTLPPTEQEVVHQTFCGT